MTQQSTFPQREFNPQNDNNFFKTTHNGFSNPAPRIALQQPVILLQSSGGISLPIEVCLKIVEEVVGADPRVGLCALMALSKSFYSLLCNYQRSIVKSISANEGTNDLYPTTVLPSWPRNTRIVVRSYPWLCEVRCRTNTIESLTSHAVANMNPSPDGRIALNLPVPNVTESELFARTERFKREALQLLYCMADSTAALDNTSIDQIRAQQGFFLESLTTVQLAVLGVFVRVLGLGYFRLTRTNYPDKTSDSIRDRWIVFEDRLLRHGPFLAWAAVVQTTGKIHEWSDEVISQALGDMEAFETGRTTGYASLQSVLWKLFCRKVECDMFDAWNEAGGLVEVEMLGYKL